MASAFCCSVLNPGLLGQLILATVAIHAARNSRMALRSLDLTIELSVVIFFEVLQELKRYPVEITVTINSIFFRLNDGGTYYGHQYRRISGYVEYSIYWYSKREDFFTKSYNIKAQKQLYLNSIRQLIKDELPINGGYEWGHTYRIQKEKELNELVDTLDKLIDDLFYLKRAQAFQYSNY